MTGIAPSLLQYRRLLLLYACPRLPSGKRWHADTLQIGIREQ